jgi:hypothetical protein
MTSGEQRKVVQRAERDLIDYRYLEAYLDQAGNLHIDGQDVGQGTSSVSDDGEDEWFTTIAVADVPRLLHLVGGRAGDDVLDVLEHGWTEAESYALEKLLRDSAEVETAYGGTGASAIVFGHWLAAFVRQTPFGLLLNAASVCPPRVDRQFQPESDASA